MLRLLFIISLIPILLTFLLRWWFGMRVLSTASRTECTCNLDQWEKTFGSDHLPPSKNANAVQFAEYLRKSSLRDWKTREPKAAASREGMHRFGMAVPPLALMCALLGLIVGRIPPFAVVIIFLTATATACTFAYLTIAPELKALLHTTRRLRETRIFSRRDDETAVLRATTALCWKEAAPPVFKIIQR